jgi:hypothetical protein
VRWNLNMVLICISFMARDAQHFFMCFLAIWTSSFEEALFSSFAHFFSGSFGQSSFYASLVAGMTGTHHHAQILSVETGSLAGWAGLKPQSSRTLPPQ